MVFSPDNADVTEMLLNMLDDMILTIKNIARIYKRLEKYVDPQSDRVDTVVRKSLPPTSSTTKSFFIMRNVDGGRYFTNLGKDLLDRFPSLHCK